MKNITITVDEEVARWARHWAAEHETSVSRLVGEMLRQQMEQDQGYMAAYRSFFSRSPQVLREPGQPLPKRDELYDR